ncbi:hypothetical protein ABZ897_02390 [Nonomuraea sp. NPDC046802]|uniref:hypothetical protein n=1 Tax=Nonomuraea sp. NPDC046802 TaxID=3154919 RepID=UPI0033EA0C2C
MSNPQQPELRRSGRTTICSMAVGSKQSGTPRSVHPHGTDKGSKGGGKGGGVPPGQRPQYPR